MRQNRGEYGQGDGDEPPKAQDMHPPIRVPSAHRRRRFRARLSPGCPFLLDQIRPLPLRHWRHSLISVMFEICPSDLELDIIGRRPLTGSLAPLLVGGESHGIRRPPRRRRSTARSAPPDSGNPWRPEGFQPVCLFTARPGRGFRRRARRGQTA